MENRKQIMIGVLSVIVCIMAVGYAYLSQQLTVNGTAHIDSRWDVRISNITAQVNGVSGGETPSDVAINEGCSTTTAPSGCTGTSANFEASLQQPGDSIVYTVTIANYGTLPAAVAVGGINARAVANDGTTTRSEANTDAILFSYDSTALHEKLEIPAATGNTPGTVTFTVTATYNSNITQQPSSEQATKKYRIDISCVQDMTPNNENSN